MSDNKALDEFLKNLKEGDVVGITDKYTPTNFPRKGICLGKTAGGKIRVDIRGTVHKFDKDGSKKAGSNFSSGFLSLVEPTEDVVNAWKQEEEKGVLRARQEAKREADIAALAPVKMSAVLEFREYIVADIERTRRDLATRSAGCARDLERVVEACNGDSLTVHDHRVNSLGILQNQGQDVERLAALLQAYLRVLEDLDAFLLLGRMEEVAPFLTKQYKK